MILSKKGVETEFLMKVVMVIMAILVILFLLLPIISILLMIHGDNSSKQKAKRVYFDLYHSLSKLKGSNYCLMYSTISGGFLIKYVREKNMMYLYDPNLKLLESSKSPIKFDNSWHFFLNRPCTSTRCCINVTINKKTHRIRTYVIDPVSKDS